MNVEKLPFRFVLNLSAVDSSVSVSVHLSSTNGGSVSVCNDKIVH